MGLIMYILMIYSDSTDPWAYGTFRSLKSAKDFKKEYQSTWDNRDWDSLDAHIIKLTKQKGT